MHDRGIRTQGGSFGQEELVKHKTKGKQQLGLKRVDCLQNPKCGDSLEKTYSLTGKGARKTGDKSRGEGGQKKIKHLHKPAQTRIEGGGEFPRFLSLTKDKTVKLI